MLSVHWHFREKTRLIDLIFKKWGLCVQLFRRKTPSIDLFVDTNPIFVPFYFQNQKM